MVAGAMRRQSMSRRVFAALIVGEVVFATILVLTIGAFSTFQAARARERAVRQVSASIAAGLMPTIADGREAQVGAQLSSVLQGAGLQDVTGLCISDSAGYDLACQGEPTHESDVVTSRAPLRVLLRDQIVIQQVVVDGLPVATLRVRFEPPGLSSLAPAGIAGAVILLSGLLVSLPWTAWILRRDVIEPLDDLGRYASEIAEGDLNAQLDPLAPGEIGELQEVLGHMASQLRERDERLQGSYHDLSEAYQSLERASKQIEQLSTVKSNFVAVAAHELRNPLATISLYSEMLEGGEMGSLDVRSQAAAGSIRTASSRLASIVSDLMDSALLERGLLPIEFDALQPGDVITEAVAEATERGRPRRIRFICDDVGPLPVIRADGLRVRQVLDNLLSNALKYSPDDTEVRVTAAAHDDEIVIEVTDQGPGVPPDAEDQLFALFGRADFGDSREVAGLGLGLAISARIVDAHGGRLTYHPNDECRGSVFSVVLPVAGPPDKSLHRIEVRVVSDEGSGEGNSA